MELINNENKSRLLYIIGQRFTLKSNNIIKIIDEPYSYKVDNIKIYIFDKDEMYNFLIWYWNNCKETFIFDFCNIKYEIPWKYFCENITDFKINYCDVDAYQKNIIENNNLVNIYDNLVNNVGLDNFIKNIIIKYYNSMDFIKNKNIIIKFSTNCGTQIYL
jgi:hypothetical protein